MNLRPSRMSPGLFRSSAGLLAVDQSVSSATNLFLVLAGATLLDGADFGAFALGASLFGVALGVTRATSGERVALGRGTDTSQKVPAAPTSVLAVTVLVLLALSGLLTLTGRDAVVAWLVGTPIILLQDRFRYIAAGERPTLALVSDAAWLAAVVAGWMLGLVVGGDVLWLLTMTTLGPAAALVIVAAPLRASIGWRMMNDLRQTFSEALFVADAWLLATSVLFALSVIGIVGSLELTGQARLLLLFFQPFFSIAYAGRWFLLSSQDDRAHQRWPRRLTIACAGYGVVTASLLIAAERLWGLPTLWAVGPVAFSITAVSQCARAMHQGFADLARRRHMGESALARLAFAAVLVVGVGPLTRIWQLNGVAVAYLMAFGVGAVDVRRRLMTATDGYGAGR